MTLLLSLLCVVVVVGSIIAVDGASGIPCPSGFFSCLTYGRRSRGNRLILSCLTNLVGGQEEIDYRSSGIFI